ncbi:MAG TPA: hypothetical protein VHD56_10970 [Tepidisphaeraceae bacterium]|nr:hypothetical protein [Tepidisphaeraceae bacterium]
MSKKAIPNGDADFVTMAENFARAIAAEPQRFEVSSEDSEQLTASVKQFRAALQASRFGQRSHASIVAKDEARKVAVEIVRRLRNVIRLNPRIDAVSKVVLGMSHEKAKSKPQICPVEPPRLKFVRALHESGAVPVHELAFSAKDYSAMKPAGADRLELFVDLIPPDEKVPSHPGENYGSRPWYLRSYKRSPIRLVPPMPRVLMRVVYWARWADNDGNVGPFSATAAAWTEGGSHAHLPGGIGIQFEQMNGPKPVREIEDARPTGPEGRSETYRVALLQVQIESFGVQANAALPEPQEQQRRQLEGPKGEAA